MLGRTYNNEAILLPNIYVAKSLLIVHDVDVDVDVHAYHIRCFPTPRQHRHGTLRNVNVYLIGIRMFI